MSLGGLAGAILLLAAISAAVFVALTLALLLLHVCFLLWKDMIAPGVAARVRALLHGRRSG